MSSRQLCSKGASDGQSLPDRTREGKKSSDQQTMDQQSSPQPEQHTRPGSAQQQAGDSATPAISPALRAESTSLQAIGLVQTSAVQVGLLSRMGSLQVQLPITQTRSSHISPMPFPLFTEDRLSSSSNKQEMCDQEVTTLIQDKTPTRSPAHISSRPGSITTVDYSTQGDPDQPAPLPTMGLGNKPNSIDNTRNFLLPDCTGRRILDIPYLREYHSSWIMDTQHTKSSSRIWNLYWKPAHTSSIGSPASSTQSTMTITNKWLPHP